MGDIERAARVVHRFGCEACSADAASSCPYNGLTAWDEHRATAILEAVNHQGAVEDITTLRRALAAAISRLDDCGHPEGAEEAREALDATGGGR